MAQPPTGARSQTARVAYHAEVIMRRIKSSVKNLKSEACMGIEASKAMIEEV